MIYANDSAHSTEAIAEELEPHQRYAEEVVNSGAMVAAFALEPVAAATSIRGDVVTDGPFVDTKEVVAGFYVIEAPDLDAALDIAGRNPALQQGGGVEVRLIFRCCHPALAREAQMALTLRLVCGVSTNASS